MINCTAYAPVMSARSSAKTSMNDKAALWYRHLSTMNTGMSFSNKERRRRKFYHNNLVIKSSHERLGEKRIDNPPIMELSIWEFAPAHFKWYFNFSSKRFVTLNTLTFYLVKVRYRTLKNSRRWQTHRVIRTLQGFHESFINL